MSAFPTFDMVNRRIIPANDTLIPTVSWVTTQPPPPPQAITVAPQATIQAVASAASDRQATFAAENAVLRVIYGEDVVGAGVTAVCVVGSYLYMLCVWSQGENDAIVATYCNGAALPSGITAYNYTGTLSQIVNAQMAGAFLQQTPPIAFTDAMSGICYSVFVVASNAVSGFPIFTARIRGRKVYDPRGTPVTAWSDNPSLCLADFLTSTVYGLGVSVDYASVGICADANDVVVSTEKSRLIGLTLDSAKPAQQWMDVMRTYAGCWIVPSGSSLKIIADTTASSTYSFSHSAGNIAAISNMKLRGIMNCPTVIEIIYTSTSSVPYTDASAIIHAPGVQDGSTVRRDSRIHLPGIRRYSQAIREATERLNKLTQLCDLSFTLDSFDESISVEVGDVVSVTHPIGLANKLMRVVTINHAELDHWSFDLVEYDPAAYSNSVITSPSSADTNLPDPSDPPAVSSVVMTEEIFQLENGIYSSRWRITWNAATYAYLAYYHAELWSGSSLIHSNNVRDAIWATPAVQEGATYVVKIAAISTIGSTGTWATQSAVAQGKHLIPGDVARLTAFEAGGTVYMNWMASADIDIWRYELRYGITAGTWETATVIDQLDALHKAYDQIPVGTWKVYVKPIDSIRQYSRNAAFATVTVTLDANAFLVSTMQQTAPAWMNLLTYSEQFDNAAWLKFTAVDVGITANATTAPDGTLTADKFYEATTTLTYHELYQAFTSVASTVYMVSMYFKAAERNKVNITIALKDTTQVQVRFDLVAVTATTTTGTSINTSILDVGNGWYKCTFGANVLTGSGATAVLTELLNASLTGTYTGVIGNGLYIWGAQVYTGSSYCEYQQTIAAISSLGVGMDRFTNNASDPSIYWITEDGIPFVTKFSAAMSTYTNALSSYHESQTSEWLGEVEDFGLSLGGQWTGEATVADISGTHISYLANSVDSVTWVYPAGLSQKTTARFARMEHEALTTSTMLVTFPYQSISIDATPREENGLVTSSAGGAVTVTLTNSYAAIKEIVITPKGVTARSATFDNVILGTPTKFDVYVFNDLGVKIVSDCQWKFKGV